MLPKLVEIYYYINEYTISVGALNCTPMINTAYLLNRSIINIKYVM